MPFAVSTPDLLMWAAAETAIIIIGASIPFLRKLVWRFFRQPKSQNSYSNTKNEQWTSKNVGTAARLGNMTAKSNAYAIQSRSLSTDDGSQKSILGGNEAGNRIMVSQQFSVHVDSDDSNKAPGQRSEWW